MPGVVGLLAVAFFVGPIVEIWLIVALGRELGAGWTVGLIAATAVAGAMLARRQGLAAVRNLQQALSSGREIGASLVEAALVLVAGIFMLVPGFLTDGLGLALLIAPLRRSCARMIVDRIGQSSRTTFVIDLEDSGPGSGSGPGNRHRSSGPDRPPPGVIDV
jgi:UPF0716 protein FxsA